jgi:hypothetical protein
MAGMTLDDLISRLEECRDELGDAGGDIEVRLASQPNYPFEWDIFGVALSTDIETEDGDEEDEEDAEHPDDAEAPVVYICEGRQLDYASRAIWNAAR